MKSPGVHGHSSPDAVHHSDPSFAASALGANGSGSGAGGAASNDQRQATMAMREHYGAMIAARDKTIKGLQRRCDLFKAEVDALRSQLSAGFQSDRLIELENAK